jgi:acyl carrier protein
MKSISQEDLIVALENVLAIRIKDESGGTDQLLLSEPLRKLPLDSLSILELGIYLEDTHGISINPGAFSLGPEATISDLLAFINSTDA